MKQPEYIEGKQAQENFEGGMEALFKVLKGEVIKAGKKAKKKGVSRGQHKPPASEKD